MNDSGLERLEEAIRAYPSALISLSGGVDSSVVAAVACRTLGERAMAVTLAGPSIPSRDLAMAREVVKLIGIRYKEVVTDPLTDPFYVRNPLDRCYYCRRMEGKMLVEMARDLGFALVADGVHSDDLMLSRPGIKAMDEWGMRHPLVEAHLGKLEVRALAQKLSLPNWDTPAGACLSSRIAHGEAITPRSLEMVDRAEEYMTSLGFRRVRVRLRGGTASVEVDRNDLGQLAAGDFWERIVDTLHSMGFASVAPTPAEYRPGGAP